MGWQSIGGSVDRRSLWYDNGGFCAMVVVVRRRSAAMRLTPDLFLTYRPSYLLVVVNETFLSDIIHMDSVAGVL